MPTPKEEKSYRVTFAANAHYRGWDYSKPKWHDEIVLEATGKKKSRYLDNDARANIYNIIERYPILQKILMNFR